MNSRNTFFALGLLFAALAGGNLFADDCNTGCEPKTCETSCKTTTTRCDDDITTCKSVLLPFSQGENAALRFAGVAHLQDLADEEDWNFHADFAIEYQQSFDSNRLGSYFLANGTNTLNVGPDLGQPNNNGFATDIRNVDLGLSSSFAGSITINPKIRNVIPNLALYVGLDRWVEGAWFDIELPFAWTQWHMDICETNSRPGGATFNPDLATIYDANYSCIESMEAVTPAPVPPLATAVGLSTGTGSSTIVEALSGLQPWGDRSAASNLLGARFIKGKFHKGGLADLPIQFGYNFWNRDCGFFGAFIRAVFPTGRINNNGSVFTPTVGYNRWQVGGGARGRVRLYEHDENTEVNLYANVYATHLFKKSECRVFDIKGLGCFSRYLLMKEADAAGDFTGNLVNFVDKFTACAESKINWQVDGLIFFDLKHRDWNWQLGYEIKARAREHLSCENVKLCQITACSSNRSCEEDCAESCDSNATANVLGGLQYGIKGSSCIGDIGSPVSNYVGTTINKVDTTFATGPLYNESNFATILDYEGAALPSALSNKVWSHLNYTWADRDYPVGAGLGFEVDFGNHNHVPRFWGIWAKAAVAYN